MHSRRGGPRRHRGGARRARLGHRTLLVTQNPDAIGRMSCNPAIGGLSKGNLVREVDALGGQMALIIDTSAIQWRLLNRSRGPAVQAPRAQADKDAYAREARRVIEAQPGLSVMMDTVVDVILSSDGLRVEGALTERGTAHRRVRPYHSRGYLPGGHGVHRRMARAGGALRRAGGAGARLGLAG
jgi:tRNA uridine 5-carboxymethylaminomethyl modification enzyme